MRRPPSARTWTGIALVAVLAVAVAALAVLAMQRVSAPPASAPRSDAPSTPTHTASPAPIASVTAPAAPPREAERFLAAGADGVVWRATAGSCEQEIPPVVERSTDDGVTWTDVTPEYRGITQVRSIDDFADVQAEMIATVLDDESDGDPCDPRAMRTFSDGAFWSDYPEVLENRSHLQADGVIAGPEGDIEVPCAEPRSIRSAGELVALVCDGQAMRWEGSAWIEEAVPAVIAVAAGEGGLYIAHLDPQCEGVQFTLAVPGEDPVALACEPGLDPALPLAIDAAAAVGSDLWVWSGDEVISTVASAVSSGEG